MSRAQIPRYVLRPDITPEHPIEIVRHVFRPNAGLEIHCHDFIEVFWCETGEGVQVFPDGSAQDLQAGDLVFLGRDDAHGFRFGPRGLTMVNVAFRPEAIAALRRRHEDLTWPWRTEGPPLRVHCTPTQMERLHDWAAELALPGQRLIDLDCFVLDLLRLVARSGAADDAAGLPAWMRAALECFVEPQHLRGGIPALAKLCGRSPARVNRIIRAAQGRTATELVNRLRIDWAAGALRMSERSVAEIAADCGMPNLGHFYGEFRKVFGVTPKRYRLDAWQVVSSDADEGETASDG